MMRRRKEEERSHLVEEAFEHAGSFDRQRSGDADGLLQNHCWVEAEGGVKQGRVNVLTFDPSKQH